MKNPLKGRLFNKFSYLRALISAFIAIGIFFLGWGVGNGKLAIGPNAVFHRSVQKNLPAHLDYSKVDELYNKLKTDYDGQLDSTKLLDGLRTGLANAAGDQYTEYFNPSAAKDFSSELNGTFTGIGAKLGKDANNNIEVIAPISGFPAEKAGLKPKDVIAAIDGKSTAGLAVESAVQKIRGPKDTIVKLTIIRGGSQKLDISITRDDIQIPSVTSKILDGNIGYIKISQFSQDTVALSQKTADSFKAAKVKGIVMDLRSDPGGLLDAAVGVSNLWLPSGKTILSERRGGVIIRTYTSDGPATLAGIRTVVLIDEGSASASEITAGALKDNNVASLIGVKSFGKGSVQQLENFSDGSLLKVTIARWYTPAGINIDKAGINPDKEVKISEDDVKNSRDPQLDAATASLNK